TLYTCLNTVTKLMASFAPFYADRLFRDLNSVSKKETSQSVHLSDFPAVNTKAIDKTLEAQMQLAQDISSMVLSLRKKVNIKVRQPLQKILVPVSNNTFAENLQHVKDLILSEVNVKELEYLTDDTLKLVKKVKPNFKTLGAKLGQNMKVLAGKVAGLTQDEIRTLENEGGIDLQLGNENFRLLLADAEIISEDVPGWQVAVNGSLTVALDVNVSDELLKEGIAREFINRMQNLRKEAGFEVTDKIHVAVQEHPQVGPAIIEYKNYICAEILAQDLQLVPTINDGKTIDINEIDIYVTISKVQTNN
ncbi:MAG: class I tRNA ligase family protein, partial [Bacteroidetes bacterium]